MPGGQWRVTINQSTIPITHPPTQHDQNQQHTVPLNPFLRNNPSGQLPINHNPSQPPGSHGSDGFRRLQQLAVNSATTLSPADSEITVFLLSSPNGPEALLISPEGGFYSPNFTTAAGLPVVPPPFDSALHRSGVPPAQNVAQSHLPNAPAAPPPAVQNQGVAVQPNGGQQAPEDPIAEILRVLIPLGGHLWLLIRLFGFVWLFTGGTTWHRTVLVGIGAIIVFVIQTGAFQPLMEAFWTPLRRHIEGLVQVENQGRGRANDQAAAETPLADTRQTGPQGMADRLLREQAEARENSLVGTAIRRAERAIALFVASLVPGVGERHVAAQDAAAREARAREEAEREEALRRERESEAAEGSPGERQVQPVEGGDTATAMAPNVDAGP